MDFYFREVSKKTDTQQQGNRGGGGESLGINFDSLKRFLQRQATDTSEQKHRGEHSRSGQAGRAPISHEGQPAGMQAAQTLWHSAHGPPSHQILSLPCSPPLQCCIQPKHLHDGCAAQQRSPFLCLMALADKIAFISQPTHTPFS